MVKLYFEHQSSKQCNANSSNKAADTKEGKSKETKVKRNKLFTFCYCKREDVASFSRKGFQ